MPIIIRHNGALNNIAAGAASGMQAGLEFNIQNQKLKMLKDENDRLVKEKLDLAESGRQLAEWKARYAGKDPGERVESEFTGPRSKEQQAWEDHQAEKDSSFRRMLQGAPDKETALEMAEEYRQEQEQEALEQSRQIMLSQIKEIGRAPGMALYGPPAPDGSGGGTEAAERVAGLAEMLQSAQTPEQLREALSLAQRGVSETNKEMATLQRRANEGQLALDRLAPAAQQALDEYEAALKSLGKSPKQSDRLRIQALGAKYRHMSSVLGSFQAAPGQTDIVDMLKMFNDDSPEYRESMDAYTRALSEEHRTTRELSMDKASVDRARYAAQGRGFSPEQTRMEAIPNLIKALTRKDEMGNEISPTQDEVDAWVQKFYGQYGSVSPISQPLPPSGSGGPQAATGTAQGPAGQAQRTVQRQPALPRTSGGGKVFDLTGQTGRTLPEQDAQFAAEDIESAVNEMTPEAQQKFVRLYKQSREKGEAFLNAWMKASPEERERLVSMGSDEWMRDQSSKSPKGNKQ